MKNFTNYFDIDQPVLEIQRRNSTKASACQLHNFAYSHFIACVISTFAAGRLKIGL